MALKELSSVRLLVDVSVPACTIYRGMISNPQRSRIAACQGTSHMASQNQVHITIGPFRRSPARPRGLRARSPTHWNIHRMVHYQYFEHRLSIGAKTTPHQFNLTDADTPTFPCQRSAGVDPITTIASST
jgi:hypothetical protein